MSEELLKLKNSLNYIFTCSQPLTEMKKLTHIGLEVFGESFNPADPNFFDCNAIVSYMKRVAE